MNGATMELRDLRTFVALASLLNFNQTGKVLHAAQSTISMRIKMLEDELDARLFERLGRKVVLTESGLKLLEYARKMLEVEDEARASVSGNAASGTVTIKAPESLECHRLPDVLLAFLRKAPATRVRILPCIAGNVAEDLRRGVTDLAFVFAYEPSTRDLNAVFLGTEELVAVAAPEHPLAGMETVGPQDILKHNLLLAAADCSYRRTFELFLSETAQLPQPSVECDSVAAAISMVCAGLGVTILPLMAVREHLAAGMLRRLPLSGGPFETAVFMLWHKDKWISPCLHEFMTVCRERLMPQQVSPVQGTPVAP